MTETIKAPATDVVDTELNCASYVAETDTELNCVPYVAETDTTLKCAITGKPVSGEPGVDGYLVTPIGPVSPEGLVIFKKLETISGDVNSRAALAVLAFVDSDFEAAKSNGGVYYQGGINNPVENLIANHRSWQLGALKFTDAV